VLTGHIGVAFAATVARLSVPLRWLTLAALLPDVVRILLRRVVSEYTSQLLTHSLPAIATLAIAILGAWLLLGGSVSGAMLLSAVCALHLPLDLLSSCKPLWPGGPWLGAGLLRYPLWDLPLELLLFCIPWYVAKRQRVLSGWVAQGWVPMAAALAHVVFLAVLYHNSSFFLGSEKWSWVYSDGEYLHREPAAFVCAATNQNVAS
jgi:hypothetical protein